MLGLKESLAYKAITSVETSKVSFCKFMAANDTKATRSHQTGIYIPNNVAFAFLGKTLERGDNYTEAIKIKWQDDYCTEHALKYYGKAKNECRITQFRGTDLIEADKIGSLLILVQQTTTDYNGYILETEEEINSFLDYFGLSPADTGSLLNVKQCTNSANIAQEKQHQLIMEFIHMLGGDFPTAREMSSKAREIQGVAFNHEDFIQKAPDRKILSWISTEYLMFKSIEEAQFGDIISKGFTDMESFLALANSVLNRRKSRAGKSLEFHLEALFDGNHLTYEAQAITEERKRPDFLFPGGKEYHDITFPTNKLIVLGAKTTCKDRWRQVVTEANRVKTKYLCTLQQGISANQLSEMKDENIILVVPEAYISMYPAEYRNDILSIKKFIDYVQEVQR